MCQQIDLHGQHNGKPKQAHGEISSQQYTCKFPKENKKKGSVGITIGQLIERAGTEKLEGMTHMVYEKKTKSYAFITKGSSSGAPVAVVVRESTLILKCHGLKSM